MAINISVASDVTDVIRGAKQMGDALGDVADSLEDLGRVDAGDVGEQLEDAGDAAKDLGRAGDRAGEQLEGGLERAGDAAKDLGRAGDRAGEQIERGLEGAQDAAKDLGKAGDKAGDQVRAGLRNAGDGADKLEDKMRAAFRATADAAKDSGKQIGDSQREGLSRAGEGLDEFKGEANSTARESAASFDGSAESIADAFQEVAANAFGGFGPAGAAAGLALAAGLGIAITKAQELAEANDEAATAAGEIGRELYEAGGRIDDADLAGKISEIMFALSSEDNPWTVWANEAKTGIGEVKEAIEGIEGITDRDVFEGLAGDVEAGQRAFDDLTDSIDRDREALEGHYTILLDGTTAISAEGLALEDSIEKREKLREKIEEATGASEIASEEVAYYTDVMGQSAEATERAAEASDAEREATEAQTEAAQLAAEAIIGKVEALDRAANANLGAAGSELDYLNTLTKSSETIAENGRNIDLNTAAGRENEKALLDLATRSNGLTDALIAAGGSTAEVTARTENARSAFIAAATSAGYTAAEAEGLATKYGLIPSNVDTRVQAHNVAQTEAEINGVARPRDAAVNVKVGSDEVTNYINGMNGKRVYVNVVPHGGGVGITD